MNPQTLHRHLAIYFHLSIQARVICTELQLEVDISISILGFRGRKFIYHMLFYSNIELEIYNKKCEINYRSE